MTTTIAIDCRDPRPPFDVGDCGKGSMITDHTAPSPANPAVTIYRLRCVVCGATRMQYR